MSWTNFHTHSRFCDGVGEPEEYIDEAIQRGIKALGFSSHAPLPFSVKWTMKMDDLPKYCQYIRSLKRRNRRKLQIFLGLEIDFVPGVVGPKAPQFQSLGLDFTLGAVHFVGCYNKRDPWSIDGSKEEFAIGLEEIYKEDIRQVGELYYSLVREMIQTQCPDLIGHLDLIKKNNTHEIYFSENETWYRKAVLETLQVISKSNTILEVNTGGFARRRVESLYPSPWILERCLKLDIPITLCSDAHKPEWITAGFEEAAYILKNISFKELYILGRKGWSPCAFSSEGLKLIE